MAQQNIDFGSFPDDPSADAIRTAFQKVQDNFNQLFGTNANSTVTSINRTPGAGVTVNYPTGNVVISANIACLQVATTSLKVGRGSDNTQSNVTITSSSQQLNIDIDPANVFSANFGAPGLGLANFNGTLTSNSFYQPYINTLGTLSSLDVSGNANFTGNSSFTNNANFTGTTVNFSGVSNVNFGSNSNIHISGGSVGQYLQTDGLGNLTWAAGGGGNGGGTPGGINTLVQFNDAGSFGANLGFSYDKVTGILSTPGLTVANLATVGNITGIFANGNSNVRIPTANGNVNISAAGNANVFVITGTGANLIGNLTTGNADLGNLATVNYLTGTLTTNAQPNITSVGTLTGLDVTGNITAGNVYANSGTIGASLLTGTLTTNAQPNVTSVGTLTSLTVTGNANVGNLNVANNTIITGNLSVLGNATYVNIESLVIEDPIISLGGGPNGDPLTTNDGKDRGTALQYYTTAPVTAFMGWDNSNSEFGFGSNVNITSEVVTFTNYGNVRASYFLGDNTQFGNANLGNTATANFFVGRFYGNANAATLANTVVDNAQPNITSVGTLSSLAVTGNTTVGNLIGRVANGNSGITIAADSNINLTAVGAGTPQLIITSTGANITGYANVSGNVSTAGIKTNNYYYANGDAISFAGTYNNSNVVSLLSSFGSNTISTTGNITSGNLTSNGVVNFSSASNVALGSNANVHITGGTAGDVLLTVDPANGTLAWGTIVFDELSNGSSNIKVTNNGNITMYIAGNATARLTATSTGTVANGTLSVSGNANVSNLGTGRVIATGNISGTQLISTIATGTAPLVVTSTTQVANLNVATAGTVTTNAQPNITSVGTLNALTVANTILPSADITYDLGSSSQRWKDIWLANSTIYLGSAGATISANATAVVINQPNGGVSVPMKPGGSNSQVQYNDNGIFGGSGGMTWNEGTTTLTVNNFAVSNNFTSSGYMLRSVATAISANGISQGTATVLAKEYNVVSTVSAGQGVRLPTAVAGMCIIITNTTATNLAVYPASGAVINSLAANAALTHGAGATLQYIAPTTTQWYTIGATYA